jgi:hypothetical protein
MYSRDNKRKDYSNKEKSKHYRINSRQRKSNRGGNSQSKYYIMDNKKSKE